LERQKLGVSCSEDDDDLSMKGATEHVDSFSVAYVLGTAMFITPIRLIHRNSKGASHCCKPLLSNEYIKT
jgi:hypothetical protein